jgi:hypothetical protein
VNTKEIVLAIGGGLLVNEFCDLSPWAARKVVVWSARVRYGKSQRAETRAEELAAVIDSRPGKLFKLLTSLTFACGAAIAYVQRMSLLMRLYLTTRLVETASSDVVSTEKVRLRAQDVLRIEVPPGSGKTMIFAQLRNFTAGDPHHREQHKAAVMMQLLEMGTARDELESTYRSIQEAAESYLKWYDSGSADPRQ